MGTPVALTVDSLSWLEEWYYRQTDGDWEHQFGIKIETLDNPGWLAEIDLEGTALEGRSFRTLDIRRSEHDWLMCSVEQRKFKISCGPKNLAECLTAFRHWAGIA